MSAVLPARLRASDLVSSQPLRPILRRMLLLPFSCVALMLPCVAAETPTGNEKCTLSVTVYVQPNLSGHMTGHITLSRQSRTLKDCFEMERFALHELHLKAVHDLSLASLSVYCVYETPGGEVEEYIAGIWTKDGRYEPQFPLPEMMKYPAWAR